MIKKKNKSVKQSGTGQRLKAIRLSEKSKSKIHIESIRIQNFRAFKDFEIKDLPNLCVFIGSNGSGKSTLFKALSFLKSCLKDNVRAALEKEGGFKQVCTRNEKGPICFELCFRHNGGPKTTYELKIGLNRAGRPTVELEILRYRRGKSGAPWNFLKYENGKGFAVSNEKDSNVTNEKDLNKILQPLESHDILAIKGLGQFSNFPAIAEFRKLIENWHLSDIHVNETRNSSEAGYAEHVSQSGDNIALVAQFMKDNFPNVFKSILDRFQQRIPGAERVEARSTEEGKVVLLFKDKAFSEPFIGRYVSDGTMKMFAFLLLLNDPNPHPLLCIEEPENQLHHQLIPYLVEELREYAEQGGQVFVTSHSTELANELKMDEVFWFTKVDGFTKAHSFAEFDDIKTLVEAGDKMGELWRQKLLKGAGPF
jgi:predicted ATPase